MAERNTKKKNQQWRYVATRKDKMAVLSSHLWINHSTCKWIEFTHFYDTEWLDELKNKTQLYAASRRLTSALSTNIG